MNQATLAQARIETIAISRFSMLDCKALCSPKKRALE
jgi:hypothetical protein